MHCHDTQPHPGMNFIFDGLILFVYNILLGAAILLPVLGMTLLI